MLRFSYIRLARRRVNAEFECDTYLYLECFLLHYRNLIACFSGKHHHKQKREKPGASLDIDFSNVAEWASGNLPSEAEVQRIVDAAAPLDGEYYTDISQFLAHLTTRRLDDKQWDVRRMARRIGEVIDWFSRHFPQTRPFCGGRAVNDTSLDAASTATVRVYDTGG